MKRRDYTAISTHEDMIWNDKEIKIRVCAKVSYVSYQSICIMFDKKLMGIIYQKIKLNI